MKTTRRSRPPGARFTLRPVRRRIGSRLRIGPIEAIDGTPVVDVKPVL